MRTEHFYIPSWESFAGKPYVKPKKLTPGVIAGTIRDAQELLRRIEYTKICQWERDNLEHYSLNPSWYHLSSHETGKTYWSTTPGWTTSRSGVRGLYPQSLGELCIELAQDSIRNAYYEVDVAWLGMCDSSPFRRDTSRDIQNLRTLMYYKRKNHYIRDGFYDNTEYFQDQIDSGDPTRRATSRERLYKLIEMIRNT